MSVKIFVDTNIWVYAHLEVENDSRHQKSNILVEKAMQPLVISTQVLHEYYSTMLKNHMAPITLVRPLAPQFSKISFTKR